MAEALHLADPLAEITEILRERHHTGRYGDCRFDVHPTVLDLMRAKQPPPDPIERSLNFGSGALRRLMGIPVVPDESLPPGGWQLVRMEHVVLGRGPDFTRRDVVLKSGAVA